MKLIVKRPFFIIIGSHVHNLMGTGVRNLEIGEEIEVEDSFSLNVWITTKDGIRGKIECGTWHNLIKNGRAEKCQITGTVMA